MDSNPDEDSTHPLGPPQSELDLSTDEANKVKKLGKNLKKKNEQIGLGPVENEIHEFDWPHDSLPSKENPNLWFGRKAFSNSMKPGRHRKGSKTRNLQGRTKGLETNFAEDEDDQKNGSKNSKPSLADIGIDPNKCPIKVRIKIHSNHTIHRYVGMYVRNVGPKFKIRFEYSILNI